MDNQTNETLALVRERNKPYKNGICARHATVGLQSDGRVIVAGGNYKTDKWGYLGWQDIVAVSLGGSHIAGLRSDGRAVVKIEAKAQGLFDVSQWEDIAAISSGGFHIAGLKADSTVVATGKNDMGQCNTEGWKDIVAISAGYLHTVGLKADGTVVAVGENNTGQCNIVYWQDIGPPEAKKEVSERYSEQMHWENMSKIMYSPYYAALSDKQHGSGLLTEEGFLRAKINLGEAIFEALGGTYSSYLELVLTADSLATTPFGQGGKNVLTEEYGYDKDQVTLRIAKELGLHDILIESLDRKGTSRRYSEEGITEVFGEYLANVDVITPELRKEFIDNTTSNSGTHALLERLASVQWSPEEEAKIAEQEENMRYAIEVLKRNGVPGGGDPHRSQSF